MQFTSEQINHFRTHGWLAVPDFWNDDEVRAMQADLERLKDEGKLRNVATEGDGQTQSQTKANLQLCPLRPHSTLFRAMPFAPKVKAAISQLIGDPVLLHLDQVFLKPGRHGAGTNWHQDNAYFKIAEPLKGTALWTAVHEANEANGTMRIIPDMFHQELEHSRDPDSDHHIRCFPDESQAVLVELPAGGALFFAYGTPHATGANNTDKERAGVALHFINEEVHQTAISGFEPGLRPYLTGPNATDGENEYGEAVNWEAEVAQALERETVTA
jgi:ectoine hydroxylase-related dioxygenase (phytanoyl-CoA dioxygenase family)